MTTGTDTLPAASSARSRVPWRTLLSVAILIVSAVFLVRTARGIGWAALVARLQASDLRWLAAVAAAILLRYAVWGIRWTVLLRSVRRVPWLAAQKALLASVFFNMVLPVARPFGGLVRSRYLARALGVAMGPIYGTAFVDQAGYSSMSLLLGALAVGLPSGEGGWASGRRIVGAVAAVAGAVSLALLWRRRQHVRAWARRRMPSAARALGGTVDAAGATLLRPASWVAIVSGGAGMWLGGVVALWCAAQAVGAGFGFGTASTAWALGSMAGIASGTPGGAGTTETAALLQLTASGVPAESALAAIVLARGIEYLVAIGLGGACALPGRTPPV